MSSKAASLLHQTPPLADGDKAALSDLPDGLTEALDRRWEEIVSGRVECRDAFEALDELRAKYCV